MTTYTETVTTVTTVKAVRWSGKNPQEVAELLDLPNVVVNVDGSLNLDRGQLGLNVAVGMWVVLHEHGGVVQMEDSEFRSRFKKSGKPRAKQAGVASKDAAERRQETLEEAVS